MVLAPPYVTEFCVDSSQERTIAFNAQLYIYTIKQHFQAYVASVALVVSEGSGRSHGNRIIAGRSVSTIGFRRRQHGKNAPRQPLKAFNHSNPSVLIVRKAIAENNRPASLQHVVFCKRVHRLHSTKALPTITEKRKYTSI